MRQRSAPAKARIDELEAALAALCEERESLAQQCSSLTMQRDALAFELATTHERAVAAERERDRLRASHERLRQELELIKHRLQVAKAERVDTTQLELEFAHKLKELEEVAGTLEMRDPNKQPKGGTKPRTKKPSGRRDLRTLNLPEERIELTDPVFEALVAEGKAVRHGFEESVRLMRQRGGMRRVVTARVKYKRFDEEEGKTVVVTTPRPKDLLDGTIATASLAAHIIHQKVGQGLPLHRLEDGFAREAVPLDRATMSRLLEHLGGTFGASVVYAMRQDAMTRSFCIATDATGFKIQPAPREDRKRQACKNGHFLVLVADRDHVLFDYLEREDGAAISASLEGFRGYIQADAKSVYDILFRWKPPNGEGDPPDGPHEVGCWSHARRKFWEATAVAKSEVAKEGLARIGRIFELERVWKDMHPRKRHRMRQDHLRPHVGAFFEWASEQLALTPERGLLRTALNYAVRQKSGLERFLDDGRLVLDNNRSERALRKIAVGRKAYLFAGSDAHALSLGHLFSLDASARLHGLDPEGYFRDLIRVLPYWPRERYLELCPRDWARTRQLLDPAELAREVGPITVPPQHAA